jgi:hypothetical protein
LELHNQVYEAFNANPLAFAIIEIITSFVIGKGVKVTAKNTRVQRILDSFWNDPDNRMESRIYDMCRELSLYGEIFVRFFVNRFDGKVKIRMIDPSIIDQVETDPDDIETQLRFHQRPIGPSPTQNVDSINIINPDVFRGQNPADPTMAGKWFEAGTEVVHFAINKVSNAKRDKSDLATLLPWLRRYKDWLTDRVRINKYKGAFLYDVSLKGADAKTIGNQNIMKNVLRTVLDRVLQEAQRVGRLSPNVDITKAYDLIFPEFDVEDNQEMGPGYSSLCRAWTLRVRLAGSPARQPCSFCSNSATWR